MLPRPMYGAGISHPTPFQSSLVLLWQWQSRWASSLDSGAWLPLHSALQLSS